MFKNVKTLLLAALCSMLAIAPGAMAAIDPTEEAAIKAGISNADVLYFSIGGGILIVLAGIWGFKMVKRLF